MGNEIYQKLYDESNYGDAKANRCPSARYYPKFKDHLISPVVDFGCGRGDCVSLMISDGISACGIDQVELSNYMLVGDITEPMIFDNEYGSSICIDVFEHLTDAECIGVLENMKIKLEILNTSIIANYRSNKWYQL